MHQQDHTFKIACLAILVGIIISCGTALRAAHGLTSEIAATAAPTAQR